MEDINLKYPQIKQIFEKGYIYRNFLKTPCIIQEKLDGCNFRIIHKNGEIFFGSRTCILTDDKFCNFGSIKEKLMELVGNLKENLDVDDFVVIGELLGYNNKGKLLIPRIKYFDEKEVRFYAFEILNINNKKFLDFVEVQQLLSTAGFKTIPYETETLTKLNFKSLLFPDIEFIEGYLLRHDNKRYKLKSEEFLRLENGENVSKRKKGGNTQKVNNTKKGEKTKKMNNTSSVNFITNGAFLNYVFKGVLSDAETFHTGFCKEIIEDYLAEEDSGEESEQRQEDKKKNVKMKSHDIFTRTYGVILANKRLVDNFEEIFRGYNFKKAKEAFMDYVLTV